MGGYPASAGSAARPITGPLEVEAALGGLAIGTWGGHVPGPRAAGFADVGWAAGHHPVSGQRSRPERIWNGAGGRF